MKLILHTPEEKGTLSDHYRKAFERASEMFIVTAYLTDWDETLRLNTRCRGFRLIIGKDFSITRKAACEAVMRWLPAMRKSQFLVADLIDGFHPKAAFWSSGGSCYAIVGSSNLTKAAFETNYEANVFSKITQAEYDSAKKWIKHVERKSVVVSGDWLSKYEEAERSRNRRRRDGSAEDLGIPLISLNLPNPRGCEQQVLRRRKKLSNHRKYRKGLIELFERRATGKLTSTKFYESLRGYWSYDAGNRLQGNNWEISGKGSDFGELSRSFVRILKGPEDDRDDTVVEEIDRLAKRRVPTRAAFLSEMLCLEFPAEYPVLNKPVRRYMRDVGFKAPRGASEGAKYIDLAKKLRFSLVKNPDHAAKNLAELDAVIWLAHGD
jgi:HKD family nuclease